ncbi:MAG: hypothetical protein JXB49_30290, partial [Bacteroidales bacterium]|nr:hypothetical protein [Bacteroidales bacterium]
SILPKILIGLGVVAVAAVLYFVVFKKKAEPEIEYDITGAWALNYTLQGDTAKSTTITFSGDKTSGTFSGLGYTGTYTVDGKNVEFIFPSSTRYSGSFTDTQNMSGTILNYQGIPGTWTATKILQ